MCCMCVCDMRCRNMEQPAGSKSVHFLRLDITDESSVKHFAASLEAEFGGVTIVVNNAGRIHSPGKNPCSCTAQLSQRPCFLL